jgi:hypothetical protein
MSLLSASIATNTHWSPISGESVLPLLLRTVGPNLIYLQIPGSQAAHLRIHDPFAAMSGENEQPHDCVAIQGREPFCAADRASFQKALN